MNVSAATTATVLHKENASPFRAESIEKAKKESVSDVIFLRNKLFLIRQEQHDVGVLIPGRGMINGIQSVCFMGCSANDKSLGKVIPTIGFGDWEAVTSAGVDAVGIVSDKDASDVKIGVSYHAMKRFNDTPNYIILSVGNNKISVYFD